MDTLKSKRCSVEGGMLVNDNCSHKRLVELPLLVFND